MISSQSAVQLTYPNKGMQKPSWMDIEDRPEEIGAEEQT